MLSSEDQKQFTDYEEQKPGDFFFKFTLLQVKEQNVKIISREGVIAKEISVL